MSSQMFIRFIFSAFIAIGYAYSKDSPAPEGPVLPAGPEIPPNFYPNPRRDEKVQDTYPGNVIVHDPYRWMEDSDNPDTKKFIAEENALTTSYLKKASFQQQLLDKHQEINFFPSYRGPMQTGKYWFSWRNNGTQFQDVLYAQESLTDDKGKIVFDPNTLSKDGSIFVDSDIGGYSIREDGLVLAYTIFESGSDWRTIQFWSLEKGNIYKEKLTKVNNTPLEWTFDNKGLFYAAYPDAKNTNGNGNDALKNRKIFYHVLGTEQSKDIAVIEFPEEPHMFMSVELSVDGKYLIVWTQNGTSGNELYIADLDKIKCEIKGKLELIPLITKDTDHEYNYVANVDKTFIIHTNKDASNKKIITIDIGSPDPAKSIKDLVPTHEKNVLLDTTAVFGKYLITFYTVDIVSVAQLHDINTGKMMKKFETEFGTIDTYYSDWKQKDFYFAFQSYLTPCIIYHCDVTKPSFDLDIFKEIKIQHFDRQKFTTEVVFYKSKDGTKIPLQIISKKGVQKNENNFTYLYGFGGFSLSQLPSFDSKALMIVDNFDGIYAIANIRGGGEYGEDWHWDGSLHKKQNGFDDFQAAAEYLIAEKYTSPKKLVISGGANGGLLVAACLNQRPELFAVGIIDYGILDMLRYDKFTAAKNWIPDYGDPSKKEDFDVLFKYSPLQNVKIPEDSKIQYPATMLTTSIHYDRVPPLHCLKFIATLQYLAKNSNDKQKNPLIISIGKNGGATAVDQVFEFMDKMSFISSVLGIKFHL